MKERRQTDRRATGQSPEVSAPKARKSPTKKRAKRQASDPAMAKMYGKLDL